MLKGIDVHPSYQRGFPFDKNKTDFAVVKITEGTSTMSSGEGFQSMVGRALGAGLFTGLYHFMNSADPVKQADAFANAARPWLGRTILALDWEQYGVSNGTACWRFVDHVHELTGVWPLVYTNRSDEKKIDGQDGQQVKQHCGLWLAQWPANRLNDWYGNTTWPNIPAGWTLAMWQCGVLAANAAAALLGYAGETDIDYFYGDAVAWAKYANPSTLPPALPPVGLLSLDDIAREVIDGKWDNGAERKKRLTAAGYDAAAVQNRVNQLLGVGPATASGTYQVQPGDNLNKIAAKYGTTVPQLVDWNKARYPSLVSNPDLIQPDWMLKV